MSDEIILGIQEDVCALMQELGAPKQEPVGTLSYQKEFHHNSRFSEESKINTKDFKMVQKKLFQGSEEPSEVSMLGSNI